MDIFLPSGHASSTTSKKGTKRKRKGSDAAANAASDPNKTVHKKLDSAYALFVNENFELVKQAQGGGAASMKDIMSILAQQWANTSESEKDMWQYRADQIKEVENANVGGKKRATSRKRGASAASDAIHPVSV